MLLLGRSKGWMVQYFNSKGRPGERLLLWGSSLLSWKCLRWSRELREASLTQDVLPFAADKNTDCYCTQYSIPQGYPDVSPQEPTGYGSWVMRNTPCTPGKTVSPSQGAMPSRQPWSILAVGVGNAMS